jgi:hypothetical protein
MRLLVVLAAAIVAASACVPGSPVYVGPYAVVTFEGNIYVFETREPAGLAEVCAFGADTTCIRADEKGHYWMQIRAEILGDSGEVTLRFLAQGMHPAAVHLSDLEVDSKTFVDCSISNRASLSSEPRACLPPPED